MESEIASTGAAIDSRETSGLRFPYGARGFGSPVTAAVGALGRRRPRIAPLAGHPELAVAAAVLAAWVLLLVFAARAVGGATSAAMPGMPMPVPRPGPSASPWATALAALPSWLLMTIAMMGPAALGKFRAATPRAIAAFSVGYLAVWAAFGLLAEAVTTTIRGVPSPQALALCLAAATAWQLTPLKHRVLRACLGVTPADVQPVAARPSTGRPAQGSPLATRPGTAQFSAAQPSAAQPSAAQGVTARCASHHTPAAAVALRRGMRFGLCCLGTCWCLMLIPLAAPGGQLPWMAGLTILVTAERLASAGRGTNLRLASRAVCRTAAGALAVAAVATLAVSGLLQ
jgi:predicted metal-binding membrane protein